LANTDRAADIFKALSDRTRLRILHLLRSGELCVGDLVAVLRVPQPTASRHLTSLRRAGLITSRRNSYWTFYALAPARSELRRRLLDCLEADTAGRQADSARLRALRKAGGCCPR
jgi:ArsR family transcriptional regulator